MRGAMLKGQSPTHLLGGDMGVALTYAAVAVPVTIALLFTSLRTARPRGSLSRS